MVAPCSYDTPGRICSDLDWGIPPYGGSVPEFSFAVVSPPPQSTIRLEAESLTVTWCYRGPRRIRSNLERRELIISGPIAQLSKSVKPPPPQSSISLNRETVMHSRDDL